MKTTTSFYLIVVVVGVFIGLKLTFLYSNVLSISYSFDTKRKITDYHSSREIVKQQNDLHHFKNNKHNSYNNQNRDGWENTLAVMKLRQMILGNAQKQIYVRTRFRL